MKYINDLEDAHIEGIRDLKLEDIEDAEKTSTRLIVNFLVDISGSMADHLEFVNGQLNTLKDRLLKGKNDARYLMDVCVTTFGNDTVETYKPFGLIEESTVFDLKDFDGSTPLGSAMLLCYKLCLERKEQYKKAGISDKYRPIIVIISDFEDNDIYTMGVDGAAYTGASIYNEMAELYTEAQESRHIAVMPLAAPGYREDRFNLLPHKYALASDNGRFAENLSGLFALLYKSIGKVKNMVDDDEDEEFKRVRDNMEAFFSEMETIYDE